MSIFEAVRLAGFTLSTPLLYKAERRLYMRYEYTGEMDVADALVALAKELGQDATLLEFGTAEMVAA
ncbi:hypothetical protein [Burkholderia sp. PAMC 28687]|uniref:hypothetical protein n=1 Tax=Burkholderia sp. PAMC 28687 TaxID=1795874 RepID=UPI00155F5E8A|nr:hypothetical protein [Burkholderia sp. PAMC 28687]